MAPFRYVPVILLLHVLLKLFVRGENATEEYKASACYGTYMNYLQIDCPLTLRVNIVAIKNGAKRLTQDCPVPADKENYRDQCCKYGDGDCVIVSHNAFPLECKDVSFCKLQATWVDTSKICNGNVYPSQTQYMEITFQCIPVTTANSRTLTTTTTTAKTVVNTTITYPNESAGETPTVELATNLTLPPLNTTIKPVAQTGHVAIVENAANDGDSFTPAMVGGMIAGIIGLMLTIFIFMFYWGRKRQVRITGGKPPQNSVWDFLLANTMSVRAFRGYDNFSSARTTGSLSSEESGSPVIRKNVWLPNISLDSGHGETVTSDDNCSIVTIERIPPNRL